MPIETGALDLKINLIGVSGIVHKKFAVAPSNTDITFCPPPIKENVGDEEGKRTVTKVETTNHLPNKTIGRPKNSKLSALAAKRNLSKLKTTAPQTNQQKTEIQTDSDSISNKSKKTFDISSIDRLSLRQNFTHMANQLRQDSSIELDICDLTKSLRCNGTPNRRLKDPSRGMRLLFPGKDSRSRGLYVRNMLMPPYLHELVGKVIKNHRATTDSIEPFDFSTCPIAAVTEAVNKKMETLKVRHKRHAKRLVHDIAQPNPGKKVQAMQLDPLSAKRLLKLRLKDGPDRCCSVLFFGSCGAGKTTVVSCLSLDSSIAPEKIVTKVKWEAEKAGRPRDYLAWLIDELPAERLYGHSLDLGEASLILPSDRSCQLLDCPGNQLGLFSDLLFNVDAVVYVCDVVRMASADDVEIEQVKDFLKVLKERDASHFPTIFIFNKMDQCNYSTPVFKKAKSHLCKHISNVLGSDSKNIFQFVPTFAHSGDGLIPPKGKLRPENGRVNFGINLVGILEEMTMTRSISPDPSPVDLKSPILLVRDIYENMGAGFTAVAYISQGLVAPGQSLLCLPSGATLTIRSVHVAGRQDIVRCAAAGETVNIVLWQVKMADVTRGSIICHPSLKPVDNLGDTVQVTQLFEATIETVNFHGRPLITGRQVLFHGFGSSVPAFMRQLLWVTSTTDTDVEAHTKLRPLVVSRIGVKVGVEMLLEAPHVCIPSLNIGVKFSLLDNSTLMATGVLTKVLEDRSALKALHASDCYDPKRLLFHQSAEVEHMEVD